MRALFPLCPNWGSLRLVLACCGLLRVVVARCGSSHSVQYNPFYNIFVFFEWHFCTFERTSIHLKNWSKVNICNDSDIFPVKDTNLHIAILCLHRYRGLSCSSESTVIFSDTFLVYCWITHGDIILNRSNNSVFPCLKIFWDSQVFHLVRTSGIWMKLETLHHRAFYSKFWMQYSKVLIWV